MKRTERHKLKQNEFARTVARVQAALATRQAAITKVLIAVLLVLIAGAGYAWWRSVQESTANERLAAALAVYETPVVPPEPPAPGSPPPVPRPGTFQTEQERLDASLPLFLEAADTRGRTQAAITARFHAAGILGSLGRYAEAEEHYRQVADQAGDSIYGRTARLGMAEAQMAQGKYDSAIEIFTELSRDPRSEIPIDGVLMHLGRAYVQAGRQEDAARSFGRIVDEFPQSPYAAEARRQMSEAKS